MTDMFWIGVTRFTDNNYELLNKKCDFEAESSFLRLETICIVFRGSIYVLCAKIISGATIPESFVILHHK